MLHFEGKISDKTKKQTMADMLVDEGHNTRGPR